MNPMLLGETLAGGAVDTTYEGFWMPAGGNDGVAAIEIFHMSAASAVTVTMQTKSSDEDNSSPTPIGSATVTSTTPDITRFPVEDALDLVRYTVEVSAGESVHFQLTQPLWAPN
jgi:hypothetical protein